MHQHLHVLQTCKSADPSSNVKLRSPWATTALQRRSLGGEGGRSRGRQAPTRSSQQGPPCTQHTAQSCRDASQVLGRRQAMHQEERNREPPPPLRQLAKRWEMAICKTQNSKFKEGPPCTTQLLWLGHPQSSGRHREVLQVTALSKLPLQQLEDSYTARLLPLQTSHLHCLALKKKIKCEHHTNSHLQLHRLLQRSEACSTRLLVSPLLIKKIPSPGPQPGEGGLLSVNRTTPPACTQVK